MQKPLRTLIAVAALAITIQSARAQIPVDVVGHMSLGQFNAFIAPQTYRDWGNEPFIAVNPLNPSQVVVSGFAYGTNTPQFGASLWYSTNAGANWSMTFPFQAPAMGIQIPRDQTFAYDSAGTLHGIFLGSNPSPGANNLFNIYHGTTANPAVAGSATWTAGTVNRVGINNADQPWMAISGNHVYVGYDNFTNGAEERVARSDNNGATFLNANDLPISAGGPIGGTTNPGTRVAVDDNGNAYSIIGIGTANLGGGVQTVTYRLNSYHIGVSGGAWDHTNDTATPGGILVDGGNSHQIDATHTTLFGNINEMRGNMTAIASDSNGDHVYVVYGKIDANGVDRLYIREFHPGGGTLVGSASQVISVPGQRAVLPSITVTDSGCIVIEYQSYVGANGDPLGARGTFQEHVAVSTDFGATWTDTVIYTYTAQASLGDPGFGGNRMLGDYNFITSLGDHVYGTFPGFGNVNAGGIDTRDLVVPFYYTLDCSTSQVPEPGPLALLVGSVVAIGFRIRRRR